MKEVLVKNNLQTNGRKTRIACLGGGNGMPKAVLAGLKKYDVCISAICATLDSGGSSGRLRKDFDIVSPGDIRRSLIALSNVSPEMKSIFEYRFQEGELKEHSFTNLLIVALELRSNSFEKAIKEMKKMLNVKHEVFPITIDKSELVAVLENGQEIEGETNIDRPKHNPELGIKKVFLRPGAKIYPKAKEAIEKADIAIIGPGDLYSSLVQVLLVDGVQEAFKASKAKKIFVSNLMTKQGETNGFSVSRFARVIEEYLGGKLDVILYNNNVPEEQRIEDYKKSHPELLEMVKWEEGLDKRFIGADLLADNGEIEHDSDKVAKQVLFNAKNQIWKS